MKPDAEQETSPRRRTAPVAKPRPGRGGLGAGARVSRGKDEAVSAARQLGREIVKVRVSRSSGRTRKIAEFELYADDAAEWIERAKELPVHAHEYLKPTAKLAAAMGQASVGPFKTKKEMFDALEANEG